MEENFEIAIINYLEEFNRSHIHRKKVVGITKRNTKNITPIKIIICDKWKTGW